MSRSLKRSLTLWAMFVILLALGLFAISAVWRDRQVETSHRNQEHSTGSVQEQTVGQASSSQKGCGPDAPIDNITVDTSFDAANEARLVRASDNVFTGRVLKEVDNIPSAKNSAPLPTTEFAVEVEKNIKGSFSGTVIVSQAGGCDPKYGRIAIINNDPLLKPGQEALFATTEDSQGGPHSLVGFQFSNVTLETDAEETRVVERFQEAKNQTASSP